MAWKPPKKIAFQRSNFENIAKAVLSMNPSARRIHASHISIVENMVRMATTRTWPEHLSAVGTGGWELRPFREGKTLFIRAFIAEYTLMKALGIRQNDNDEVEKVNWPE